MMSLSPLNVVILLQLFLSKVSVNGVFDVNGTASYLRIMKNGNHLDCGDFVMCFNFISAQLGVCSRDKILVRHCGKFYEG